MEVSVVVTAFNAAQTIHASLQSVLNQDFNDFEIIVVDDGSSDATVEVVQAIASPRIRLFTIEHRGRSAALNHAIGFSSAEFIAIHDADDISQTTRLSQQVACLKRDLQIDVLGGQMQATNGSRTWNLRFPAVNNKIQEVFDDGFMPLANPTVMFRRSWFTSTSGYDTSCERLEDLQLFFVHRKSTIFAALDTDLVTYTFRTLDFQQWRAEERDRLAITGTSHRTQPGPVGYLNYRVAVQAQKLGLGITRRSNIKRNS